MIHNYLFSCACFNTYKYRCPAMWRNDSLEAGEEIVVWHFGIYSRVRFHSRHGIKHAWNCLRPYRETQTSGLKWKRTFDRDAAGCLGRPKYTITLHLPCYKKYVVIRHTLHHAYHLNTKYFATIRRQKVLHALTQPLGTTCTKFTP